MPYRSKPIEVEPIAYSATDASLRWARFVKLMAEVAEQLEREEGKQTLYPHTPACPEHNTNTGSVIQADTNTEGGSVFYADTNTEGGSVFYADTNTEGGSVFYADTNTEGGSVFYADTNIGGGSVVRAHTNEGGEPCDSC